MTPRERRFDALQRLGCIACLLREVGYQAPDIHHIVDKGYRKHSGGDMATIPLCPWHHRGVVPDEMTAKLMTNLLGPSLALDKPLFIATFGTERELLGMVNGQLKVRA